MFNFKQPILKALRADTKGSVGLTFAITSVPLMLITGVAVDYGIAVRAGTQVQMAVDSAALNAASRESNRESVSTNVFAAAISGHDAASTASATGSNVGTGWKVTGSITVNTMVLKLAGVKQITVTRSAIATYPTNGTAGLIDKSCILTMGGDMSTTDNATTLNGAPNASLTGCTIRSNKSMKCNGHSTGATGSYAVGTVEGCDNAYSGAEEVKDVYAGTAQNITRKCGNKDDGVSWAGDSAIPGGENVITVDKGTYQEVHICGDLNLTGTGTLTGANPAKDTVIVVENGKVNMANHANITANQTTIVLAGGGDAHPVIDFPNGNGKAATLNVSASTDAANPWKGLAMYQNPALTDDVDMDFKPGANLLFDGVVYFPNAKITMSGNMGSGSAGCSKIVSGEFVLNGSVNLTQSNSACDGIKVTQYQFPGTDKTYSYLAK